MAESPPAHALIAAGAMPVLVSASMKYEDLRELAMYGLAALCHQPPAPHAMLRLLKAAVAGFSLVRFLGHTD